jgi:phosphoglycolate phosphatase
MKTSNPLSAILIDLDGTLMDTVPDLAAAANRMRLDFGLPELPVDRIALFVGKGADVLIHRALTDDMDGHVDEAALARGRSSFYPHYHELNGTETVVYEGVPEALRLMCQSGLKLACVTNKPREFTLPLLERLGLSGWFSSVVAGDDVQQPKPDPALLLEACRRLGVEPLAALMIGDSINDVLAAQAAGMGVILVETGYNEGEPTTALKEMPGVETVLPTLLDVAGYLAKQITRNRA